jgi:hypothetical protein
MARHDLKMQDEEWLGHGLASINLLLDRQNQRDRLQKECAAIIASPWVKNATLSTFWPEFKEEEERAKRIAAFETQKARIRQAANAKRKSKLDGKRTQGTR